MRGPLFACDKDVFHQTGKCFVVDTAYESQLLYGSVSFVYFTVIVDCTRGFFADRRNFLEVTNASFVQVNFFFAGLGCFVGTGFASRR